MIVAMHLFNTYFALILTYLVTTLPYCILMMTGYFNTLSMELDEAVMIDGGSRWKALWSILVPVSIPGMVSVGMYTFMQAWNEYTLSSMFTNPQTRTIPVALNSLIGQLGVEWDMLCAGGMVAILPVCVMFFFAQKRLVEGLTAGAVKG